MEFAVVVRVEARRRGCRPGGFKRKELTVETDVEESAGPRVDQEPERIVGRRVGDLFSPSGMGEIGLSFFQSLNVCIRLFEIALSKRRAEEKKPTYGKFPTHKRCAK